MKTQYLLTVISILIIAGCTTVQRSDRVSTSLSAREYNSIASRYMERPTFVSIEEMSDGSTVLMVQMDTYSVPSTYRDLNLSAEQRNALRHSQVRFLKDHVAEYVEAIDKFAEWEELARERGDAFTREINRVPTWANMGSGNLVFSFHSGNDQNHFLVVAFAAAGTVLEDQALYFDSSNITELKRLLVGFSNDSLQRTDIDSVYR